MISAQLLPKPDYCVIDAMPNYASLIKQLSDICHSLPMFFNGDFPISLNKAEVFLSQKSCLWNFVISSK